MKAREIMKAPVVTAHQDATVGEVAHLMLARGVGSVLVVNDRARLCGIVTDSDFIPQRYRGRFGASGWLVLFGRSVLKEKLQDIYDAVRAERVREVMSFPVVTAKEDAEIDSVVNRMLAYQVHHIPIVRGRVPVGMVARHDLLLMMS
jgi:CBS domain-containing protein